LELVVLPQEALHTRDQDQDQDQGQDKCQDQEERLA